MKTTKLLTGVLLIILSIYSCKKEEDAETASRYISMVFDYQPAPGQYINETGSGTKEAAKALIGGTDALVSLGSFGGFIIAGFDHSIPNKEGADLGIYGNPNTGTSTEWSEPGIVSVMRDANSNGLPDDGEWYELAGSEYANPQTIKNYTITYSNPKNSTADIPWKDNLGNEGWVLRNTYHSQEYYPLWASNQESISFTGSKLPSALLSEGINTNKPFAWGYADSGSEEFLQIRNAEGRGYNTFDISWAVDKNGNKVNLQEIDFIKIYTGQNSNGSPDGAADPSRQVGEVSTEISGAIDLHLK